MLFNTQGIGHTSTNIHYPNLKKQYIVYTDASDDACQAQLSQEHDGTEFPIPFLSCTFNRNGAPQNKKSTVYITQSQNAIITFRELK